MSRCIPCEAKALLNKQKLSFLIDTAQSRAVKEQIDYVVYEDSEDSLYKICTFDEAVRREEKIVVNISRFEGANTR